MMNDRIKYIAEQSELNATLLFNKEKLETFSHKLIEHFIAELCMQLYWQRVELSDYRAFDRAVKNTEKQFGYER